MAAEGKAASIDRREGWMQQAEPISPSDRRAVQTLLSALTPLSDLRDRPIPLPFAVVFLSVVLKEGQPVGRYAKELNMTRYSITRYIRSIGDHGRHSAVGLGLITIKRGYRAKTAVVLTDKGRAVAAQVFSRLRGTRAHKKTDQPKAQVHLSGSG
jgi:DNA-binding MarR family transcriptional regulator